jgi:hypothetical protein
VLTPLAPKHTKLEARSSCFRSLFVIKKTHNQQIQIINPKSKQHLLHIQQQWYPTPILHNVIMHIHATYVIHGCHLITNKKNEIGIMDNKLVFRISFYMCSTISQPTPSNQCFLGLKLKF